MSVPDNEMKSSVAPTERGALEQIVERLREAAHFCTDIIELEKHCNTAANDLDALIASVGVSVTVDEANLPNGDTAGCGAETNSPAALVGTKKVYIKPLRTIVEVQAAYADQIRDWLNAAPVDAGVREALKPLMTIVNNIAWCHDIDGLRKARDRVNALLASSQPVFDREKIAQLVKQNIHEWLSDYVSYLPPLDEVSHRIADAIIVSLTSGGEK